MKTILSIVLFSLLATTITNAQLRDSSSNNYTIDANALFQKAKKQKTAAWILLGTGTGLLITGCAIIGKEASEEASAALTTIFTLGLVTPEEPKRSAAGSILAVAGGGAMLASIPLFIASGKNKGKAALILKNENVFFSPQINVKKQLAAGLKINL